MAEDEAPFLRRDFHRGQLGGARESKRRHWRREQWLRKRDGFLAQKLGLRAAGGVARPRAEWKEADMAETARASGSTAANALVDYFRQHGDSSALLAVDDLLFQTEDLDVQDILLQHKQPDDYFDYGNYGHFDLPPEMQGDSGFAPIYRDPWPSSANQVGHFLSILDMALRYERRAFPYSRFMLWAAVGHEMVPDSGGHRAQVWAGFKADFVMLVNRKNLYDVFMNGSEEELKALLGDNVDERIGNSMADLLLSRKAFELAKSLVNGDLKTANEVAQWIENNLLNQP